MKLITHNMLTSRCLKGVITGYPLKIEAEKFQKIQIDFNPEFLKRTLSKITWDVLKDEAKKFDIDLPSENPISVISDNDLIEENTAKKIHEALFEIEILEGYLVCPETGHKFQIKNGIPNMLINECQV